MGSVAEQPPEIRSPSSYFVRPFVRPESDYLDDELLPAFLQAIRALTERLREDFILPSLACSTGSEYREFISAHGYEFAESIQAIHLLVQKGLSERRAFRVAVESYNLPKLPELARRALGDDASEEIHFATETFARAVRLVSQIAAKSVAPIDRDRDGELVIRFSEASLRYHIALYTIVEVVRNAITSPEVTTAVLELFREGALTSYATAREGLALRTPPPPELAPLPIDAEDRALAAASLPVLEGLQDPESNAGGSEVNTNADH